MLLVLVLMIAFYTDSVLNAKKDVQTRPSSVRKR